VCLSFWTNRHAVHQHAVQTPRRSGASVFIGWPVAHLCRVEENDVGAGAGPQNVPVRQAIGGGRQARSSSVRPLPA